MTEQPRPSTEEHAEEAKPILHVATSAELLAAGFVIDNVPAGIASFPPRTENGVSVHGYQIPRNLVQIDQQGRVYLPPEYGFIM